MVVGFWLMKTWEIVLLKYVCIDSVSKTCVIQYHLMNIFVFAFIKQLKFYANLSSVVNVKTKWVTRS